MNKFKLVFSSSTIPQFSTEFELLSLEMATNYSASLVAKFYNTVFSDFHLFQWTEFAGGEYDWEYRTSFKPEVAVHVKAK